ncbi:MAG TPA: DoxX family protein [Rubricoccaceae bacterium]|nr:DoxX family protein [Rubricoccaceae bacterium]
MPLSSPVAFSESRARRLTRYLLAALFLITGTLHFTHTAAYAAIIPPGFPLPRVLVLGSGVLELLGAAGLLWPDRRVRRWAAYGLALLLVAVFPANIYMAAEGIGLEGASGRLLLWLRLPLQLPLIAAAWWVGRGFTGRAREGGG